MKLKKGQLDEEAYNVIMHDLECLELETTEDNEYHLKLLIDNLKDLFGRGN